MELNEFVGDVKTATAPGAMGDLPGFIMENIQKYLQSFGPANEKRAALFKQLQQGAAEPGLLHDLISEAAGLSNPVAGMLGPIGKVTAEAIGSPGAAKAINQAQKKIVKAIFRGDPEVLKDVVKAPGMMHVGVPGAAGGMNKAASRSLIDQVMEDAFAHFQPSGTGGVVRFDPAVLKGIDPKKRTIMAKEGVEGVPDMAVHEATHFLNEPATRQLYNAPVGSAARIDARRFANALYPFTAHSKYGPDIMADTITGGNAASAFTEGLSYLSQPTGRNPAATWLNQALTSKPRQGGIGQFPPEVQRLLQEALAAAQRVPGAIR